MRARPRYLTILALGDESQSEGIAAGRGTIGRLVVGAIESAVAGASLGVLADGGVPGVAGVAVGVATLVVDPAPVGVDGDLAVLVRAGAGARALGPSHLGMGLGGLGADLLGGGHAQEGREGCKLGEHLGDLHTLLEEGDLGDKVWVRAVGLPLQGWEGRNAFIEKATCFLLLFPPRLPQGQGPPIHIRKRAFGPRGAFGDRFARQSWLGKMGLTAVDIFPLGNLGIGPLDLRR
jgi:hypothetical protein